jgi:hypothetical protein
MTSFKKIKAKNKKTRRSIKSFQIKLNNQKSKRETGKEFMTKHQQRRRRNFKS